MDTDLEIVITLTPRNSSFERVLILNPSNSKIEIGRASKHATKGIVAGKDNAWVDSPIMSRQHARIELQTSPVRALNLYDLASTHGTFIEGRRLKAEEPYAINNGEHITFGQLVTNGAAIFNAQEFQIRYYWQFWSNPVSNIGPEQSKGLNRVFGVPGYGDDDDDDDDDDDGDVFSDMSYQEEGSYDRVSQLNKDKMQSNREMGVLAQSHISIETNIGPTSVRLIDLTQEQVGKSEGSRRIIPIDIIDESDDEAPESLPILSTSKPLHNDQQGTITEHPHPKESLLSVDHTANHQSNSVANLEEKSVVDLLSGEDRNPAEELGAESKARPAGKVGADWAVTYDDSDDEDRDDAEHYLGNQDAQAPIMDKEPLNVGFPMPSRRVMVEDSQIASSDLALDNGNDTNNDELYCHQWTPPLPRAPSPSDAALARRHEEERFIANSVSNWQPKVGSTHGTVEYDPLELSNDQVGYSQAGYRDGPFVNWSDRQTPTSYPTMLNSHQTAPWDSIQESHHLPSSSVCKHPFDMRHCDGVRKSSRLPISDIVNETANATHFFEACRKRKADHISAVEDEGHGQSDNVQDAQPRTGLMASGSFADTFLQSTASSGDEVADEDRQPAKKKVKTSSKSPGRLGAFVSGMLIGSLSLAGAFAAFVATIPDSVKDEVRLEF